MKQRVRLTENDLHRIIAESVNKLLKESSFLDSPVYLNDDDYVYYWEARSIANEWFNNWKRSSKSTLHSIRYAESYVNSFESDDDYAERLGEHILKNNSNDEYYQEMLPYAKYIGYYLYHNMKKYIDEAKAKRTKSISDKRKETKRKKDADKYLSRFKGYSDETKSQMDKMWDDYSSDPINNPSVDEPFGSWNRFKD